MKACAAPVWVLGTLLLAVGCGGNGATTPTAPSTPGPATPSAPINTGPFAITGIVTNHDGVPVAGAVVTMGHYLNGVLQWPSAVADPSGAYRVTFLATVLPRPGSVFLARAQVVAEGYELYWRSLTVPFAGSSNDLVSSFQLYPAKRVSAGDSMVASFPSDVGECTGWVAARCGIVRVLVPRAGNLTVEVTSTNQLAGPPTLEICCVAGNEIYGNPLTLPVAASGEYTVWIELPRDSTAAESFVVKTSLRPN